MIQTANRTVNNNRCFFFVGNNEWPRELQLDSHPKHIDTLVASMRELDPQPGDSPVHVAKWKIHQYTILYNVYVLETL